MKEFVPTKIEKKYKCPQCGGALDHMGYCDPCKIRKKAQRKKTRKRMKFKAMGLKR